MIKGLDKFQEHFTEYRDSFVVIGGVACHEGCWQASRAPGSSGLLHTPEALRAESAMSRTNP
jgi:hypothetical protein